MKQPYFWGKLTLFMGCLGFSFALSAQQLPYLPFSGQIPAQPSKNGKNQQRGGQTENDPNCSFSTDREFNGACNNFTANAWGMHEIEFARMIPATYANGVNSLVDRGNPRMISNLVSNQTGDIFSADNFSAYMFSFLQFIDHDITATLEGSTETAHIPVPAGDPFFDPFNTGTQILPFTRSVFSTTNGGAYQQTNELTAWVDGSSVYGSDDERAAWLRSGQHGKLKMWDHPTHGAMLPCNTPSGDCNEAVDPAAPFMAGNQDNCGNFVHVFVAGDVRANEQPSLLAMHTLFAREHNRICDKLVASGSTNDESNFQYARRMVSGIIQSILYNEVLPVMGIQLQDYRFYSPWERPDILTEFATAGFRLGHTMLTDHLRFEGTDGNPSQLVSGCGSGTSGVFGGTRCLSGCTTTSIGGEVPLMDAFFNPSLLGNNGIDDLFRGLQYQPQQEIDPFVVSDVRNFLFGAPGQGGMDLVSLNIQRGRDHGLPDYNTLRQQLGLPRLTNFNEISSDAIMVANLRSAYRSVDEIDAWVGMVSEDHMPGAAVGESLAAIIKLQFEAIRDGDRFWFENDFMISSADRNTIRNTRLADLVNANTKIDDAQDVFMVRQRSKEPVNPCTALTNGGFELDKMGWQLYVYRGRPNEASFETNAGVANIEILETIGGVSHIRLHQDLALKAGKEYRISYRMKSSGNKRFWTRLMRNDAFKTRLWQRRTDLTNQWTTFGPFSYTPSQDEPFVQLQLLLGDDLNGVDIDFVEIEEVDCCEQLTNGEFESSTAAWSLLMNRNAGNDGVMTATNGALNVAITKNTNRLGHIRVEQFIGDLDDAPTSLSFTAKSNGSKSVLVRLTGGSTNKTLWQQRVTLTANNQTFGPYALPAFENADNVKLRVFIGGNNRPLTLESISLTSDRCTPEQLQSKVEVLQDLLVSATTRDNQTIDVTWNTLSNMDMIAYRLERYSSDINNWETLASFSESDETMMTYVDFQPWTGDNHYRVRAYAADGATYLSLPVTAQVKATLQESVLLFPNPTSDVSYLRFDGEVVDSEIEVTVINSQGIICSTSKVLLENNVCEVPTYNFPSGIYFIKIKISGKPVINKRLVINRV